METQLSPLLRANMALRSDKPTPIQSTQTASDRPIISPNPAVSHESHPDPQHRDGLPKDGYGYPPRSSSPYLSSLASTFETYYSNRGRTYNQMGSERVALNKTLPQFRDKDNNNRLNSALRLAVNVNDTSLALSLLRESELNREIRKQYERNGRYFGAAFDVNDYPVIDIDHCDRFQFRAIDDAVAQGNTYMAKILRDHGAST